VRIKKIPVGGNFFRTRPDRPRGPSSLLYNGSFPGVKRPGRGADHPPVLAPRSRKSRAIPLTPPWAFGSVTGYLYLYLYLLVYKYIGMPNEMHIQEYRSAT
jgi:hypothetical protein